jgi:hypothetical protein
MSDAEKRWLKYAEAAEALAVDVRTIKRWLSCQTYREALLAVRHGKQWRIPRTEDVEIWGMQTGYRLRAAGVHLRPTWEKHLSRLSTEYGRYQLVAYHLWLAACMKAVEHGSFTQEARDAILLLWQAACKILDPLPSLEMQMDKLKARFPDQLLSRGFSGDEVRSIMGYWPDKRHLTKVSAAHTLGALEEMRRPLDYAQAVQVLALSGQPPTADNVRPLLHKDIAEHINDTGQKLPLGLTIKAHNPEDLRQALEADALNQMHSATPRQITEHRDAQGKTYAQIEGEGISFLDLREPQTGLRLRNFRKRHPQKKPPQRDIIAAVYGIRETTPGAEAEPQTGKTPQRGHKD